MAGVHLFRARVRVILAKLSALSVHCAYTVEDDNVLFAFRAEQCCIYVSGVIYKRGAVNLPSASGLS
jgi:hypothetical protein